VCVREEGCDIVEIRGGYSSVNRVVIDQCLNKLRGNRNTRSVQASQSLVARCKEGDVSLVAEGAQQVELLEQGPERVELLMLVELVMFPPVVRLPPVVSCAEATTAARAKGAMLWKRILV
jgi:hypothetical protein